MAEKKRLPTSGTRKGTGAGHGGPAKGPGAWGAAVGMGWGGPSRRSGGALRPMTSDERARLRQELIKLYFEIARDPKQHPAMRMQAAQHLLERLDNPFSTLSEGLDCLQSFDT